MMMNGFIIDIKQEIDVSLIINVSHTPLRAFGFVYPFGPRFPAAATSLPAARCSSVNRSWDSLNGNLNRTLERRQCQATMQWGRSIAALGALMALVVLVGVAQVSRQGWECSPSMCCSAEPPRLEVRTPLFHCSWTWH